LGQRQLRLITARSLLSARSEYVPIAKIAIERKPHKDNHSEARRPSHQQMD